MNEELDFVFAESSGVPILLCPAEISSQWEGINEPSNGRVVTSEFYFKDPDSPRTDYERACDLATEYVSTIQIGDGSALLFGDEIPVLYWVNSTQFIGGYALTWIYLPEGDEPDYQSLIKILPTDFFSETGQGITCSDKGFLIFPSTQTPLKIDYFKAVEVLCPAGVYTAAIGFYETPDTSLRIIKIQRQD